MCVSAAALSSLEMINEDLLCALSQSAQRKPSLSADSDSQISSFMAFSQHFTCYNSGKTKPGHYRLPPKQFPWIYQVRMRKGRMLVMCAPFIFFLDKNVRNERESKSYWNVRIGKTWWILQIPGIVTNLTGSCVVICGLMNDSVKINHTLKVWQSWWN